MMTGYNRTQRDYPLSFKLAVVGQVEKGEMPYKQAQQRYGIQGRSTVLVWLCKYGRLDWSPALPDLVKRKRPVAQTAVPPTPEQRIRELEEQLEQASQKTEFFNYLSITCSNCRRLICMRLPFIMSQPASLFSSANRLNLFSPIRKYFDASSMVRVYFSHTGISLLFIRYPLSHVSCHIGYKG